MHNDNSIPAYLPRDQVFRYTDRRPCADIPELEKKYDARVDHLQEQINKMVVLIESKQEIARKSITKHNFLKNSGFTKVTAGVPEGWSSAGAGVTFSQQTIRPGGNTANYSIRIASGANAGTLTFACPVWPGRKFSCAGWFKVTTGTGKITLTTNGTNAPVKRVPLTVPGAAVGGWTCFPSIMKDAITVDVPTDATTVTLTLQADANSTIDFCELQHGHGSSRNPHLWVPNEADALPAGGVVASSDGNYTPTGTAVLNVTAINPGLFSYIKVGTHVTVDGPVTVTPTAAGQVQYRLSLSVASNIGAAQDLSGVTTYGQVAGLSGDVVGVAATDDALVSFVSPDNVQRTFQVHFMYRVI